MTMMRYFVVLWPLLWANLAAAQVDDAQAIAVARPIVAKFASDAAGNAPRILRETMDTARGPTEVVHVTFGEVVVFLSGSGEFMSFANLSPEDRRVSPTEPDRYETDEEAWRALEAILADFDIPSGLTRTELVRDAPGRAPYAMRFRMLPRPHGYDVDGGNGVTAEVHQKTGRLNALRISKGWTYEPPNIRISREQAVEIVRRAHGGDAQEWEIGLRYSSVNDRESPAYTRELNANKTMRLYYGIWSSRGNATVDSVTGDIVRFISADQWGHAPNTEGPASAARSDSTAAKRLRPHPVVAPTGKDAVSKSGPAGGTIALVIITFLAGAGALALALRKHVRT